MTRPLESVANYLVNLGKDGFVAPDGREVIIVDMQAKFCFGETIAVVFGVDYKCKETPCDFNTNEPAALLRATLYWGLGAASFQATLDIRNGTTVFVPAETIEIGVRMLVVPPLGVALSDIPCSDLPRKALVKAGFAYGCAGRWDAARLTEPIQLLAGEKKKIAVPNFASGFTLVPTNASTLLARVLSDGNGPYPEYQVTGPFTTSSAGFPIINGGRCIEVENPGGTPMSGFVIFRLDL